MLYQSSQIGIVAVAVALLMIGGEFDLSAGVAVITAALTASMVSYELSANLWVGAMLALVLMLLIGFINGYLVVKTGIPSFLVTLSTFFMLQGINLGVTKKITGTVADQGHHQHRRLRLAQGGLRLAVQGRRRDASASSCCGGCCSRRSPPGSCCAPASATGSSPSAATTPAPARSASRWPRSRSACSWASAFLAWFYGMHRLYAFNTVQAGEGVGNEFLFIIAAVVGGTLLTGGHGSAIGAAIGAFIFGMTVQGIVYAGWDPNWFRLFLGVMLLLAVMTNLYVKKLSTTRR